MSLNRALYLSTAGSVAAMLAFALFQKQDIDTMSSTDVLAILVFCSALAAAACILIYSRWGGKWRRRMDQRVLESDDQARLNARKGEVRRPPPM